MSALSSTGRLFVQVRLSNFDDLDVCNLTDEEFGCLIRAEMYAKRQERDGLISGQLFRRQVGSSEATIAALVAAGFLEDADPKAEGYRPGDLVVTGFLDRNMSNEQIRLDKEAAAERKRKSRAEAERKALEELAELSRRAGVTRDDVVTSPQGQSEIENDRESESQRESEGRESVTRDTPTDMVGEVCRLLAEEDLTRAEAQGRLKTSRAQALGGFVRTIRQDRGAEITELILANSDWSPEQIAAEANATSNVIPLGASSHPVASGLRRDASLTIPPGPHHCPQGHAIPEPNVSVVGMSCDECQPGSSVMHRWPPRDLPQARMVER